VLNELRGVQVIDGELVVVAAEGTADGERRITMSVDDAHAIGCILIELRQLAKEREQELRATGELLDIRNMRDEFATRLRRRQVLNGSDENVDWATVIRPKPDRWN
jgi:tRNA threonylcarbamoyladenosine modification (KEOPS) complex Cgi121 subunit